MGIKGSFYATSGTDRPYYYEDFNAEKKDIFANGIATRGVALTIQMQASAVLGTMKSQINPGIAYVEGIRSEIYDSPEEVTHDTADVSDPRLDVVALEINTTAAVRNSRIVIVKGTPDGIPSAPALITTATQYQMALAEVLIPAGETDAANFTYSDKRVLTYAPIHLGDGTITKNKLNDDVFALIPSLYEGINIPASANMNVYTESGTFICPSDAVAATLYNVPMPYAFKLTVNHVLGNSNHIVQKYFIYFGIEYIRISSNGGDTWTAFGVSIPPDQIETDHLKDNVVTKNKLNDNALDWELIADEETGISTKAFSIPSQAGKSEMLIIMRGLVGSNVSGAQALVPLGDNGVPFGGSTAFIKLTGPNLANDGVDIRQVYFNGPTSVTVSNESGETTSNLKAICIYVR